MVASNLLSFLISYWFCIVVHLLSLSSLFIPVGLSLIMFWPLLCPFSIIFHMHLVVYIIFFHALLVGLFLFDHLSSFADDFTACSPLTDCFCVASPPFDIL